MKLFELKKGIPRNKMPQIHAIDIEGDYDYQEDMVDLKSMKPVQTDRKDDEYKDAIKKIKSKKAKQILLDKDYRIVNGHHRYDAYRHLGYDKVPAIIVDATLEELMDKYSHTVTEEFDRNTELMRALIQQEIDKNNLKTPQEIKKYIFGLKLTGLIQYKEDVIDLLNYFGIKVKLNAEAGGGGGGAGGGAGAGAGASAGGDGGAATSSSGDSGSADSGGADSGDSPSSDSTPNTQSINRGFFAGTLRPSKNSKKKKKKKKKNFDFGGSIYDSIDFTSKLGKLISENKMSILLEYNRQKTIDNFGERIIQATHVNLYIGGDAWIKQNGGYPIRDLDARQKWNNNILAKFEQIDPTKNNQYVMWLIKVYLNVIKGDKRHQEEFEEWYRDNIYYHEDSNDLPHYTDFEAEEEHNEEMYIFTQIEPAELGGFRLEDGEQITNVLTRFHRIKPQLPEGDRDINRYKTFHDLEEFVDLATNSSYGGEITNDALNSKDVEVIYNGPLGTVAIPHSHEASCQLGRGTKWCTATRRDTSNFEHYRSLGDLIIYNEKPGNAKYQIHVTRNGVEIRDARDRLISFSKKHEFLHSHPVLSELIKKKEDEVMLELSQLSVHDLPLAYGSTERNLKDEVDNVKKFIDVNERIKSGAMHYVDDYYINYALPDLIKNNSAVPSSSWTQLMLKYARQRNNPWPEAQKLMLTLTSGLAKKANLSNNTELKTINRLVQTTEALGSTPELQKFKTDLMQLIKQSTQPKIETIINRKNILDNMNFKSKIGKLIFEGKLPDFEIEWDEAKRYPEFERLGKDEWISLVKDGEPVKIKNADDINNTDAGTPENFYDLEKDKRKRALQQYARGETEMPIVAVYSDGHKELIGGNTRLTLSMLRNGSATVWHFDVPDDILEGTRRVPNCVKNEADVSQLKPQTSGTKRPLFSPQRSQEAYEEWLNGAAVDTDIEIIGNDNQKYLIRQNTDGDSQHFKDDAWYLTDANYDIVDTESYPDPGDLLFSHSATGYEPIDPNQIDENFADGKVKGKSRPGRVKKAGASCKGSVSSLRAKAKKHGGEKGKMYHWCANMKAGNKKKGK